MENTITYTKGNYNFTFFIEDNEAKVKEENSGEKATIEFATIGAYTKGWSLGRGVKIEDPDKNRKVHSLIEKAKDGKRKADIQKVKEMKKGLSEYAVEKGDEDEKFIWNAIVNFGIHLSKPEAHSFEQIMRKIEKKEKEEANKDRDYWAEHKEERRKKAQETGKDQLLDMDEVPSYIKPDGTTYTLDSR